jgi:hypothetical protein
VSPRHLHPELKYPSVERRIAVPVVISRESAPLLDVLPVIQIICSAPVISPQVARFSECRMAYSHYGGVSGAWASGTTPLDEVDPDLVGKLATSKLSKALLKMWKKQSADDTFLHNLKWILYPQEYQRAVDLLRARQTVWPITDRKWSRHVQQLASWTICRPARDAELASPATNRYFAILKEADLARSIVDCAAFSVAVREVASIAKIRLPTIPELLQRLASSLSRAHRAGRPCAIFLSDLRHFFHQIALHPDVQPYFAVRLREAVMYIWQVLPMGHTISPIVAQTISYALLLLCQMHAEGGVADIPYFATSTEKRSPGDTEALVAAIWYDNLISAGELPAANRLKNAWAQTCDRYHAVLKFGEVYSGGRLSREGDDEEVSDRPVVLGLRLAVDDGVLSFRHKTANIIKWTAKAQAMRERGRVTLREMSRLLGVAMFDGYVRTAADVAPDDEFPGLVAIGRRVGRLVFCRDTPRAWDTEANYAASAADLDLLVQTIARIARNPWLSISPPASPTFYLATDSSSTHWGGMWWQSLDRQPTIVGNPWVGVSVRLHISAKEALAALLALKRAPPEAQHCTVRVAIDAQAIVYAYRKRYSGSRILHDIITRCLAIAKSKGLRLQFVWIRGEDNASDIISRPDKWVGDSMANIDWTTPDAVLRMRRTVSRLGEEAPFSGCEENSPEDVVENLYREETDVDTDAVSQFDLPSEEGR